MLLEQILNVDSNEFVRDGHIYRCVRSEPPAPYASYPFLRRLGIAIHPCKNPYSPIVRMLRKKVDYYYAHRIFHDRPLAEKFARRYLGGLAVDKNSVILDYGCGRGRSLGLLAQLGYDALIGQDVFAFPDWKNIHAEFIQVPASFPRAYPYQPGRLDVVLNFMVLQFMDPGRLDRHIAAVAALLRPGGYLVLLDRNDDSPARWYFRTYEECPYSHPYALLKSLLEKNGLKVVRKDYEAFYAPVFPLFMNAIRDLCLSKENFDFMQHEPRHLLDKILYAVQPPEKRGLILIQARKS